MGRKKNRSRGRRRERKSSVSNAESSVLPNGSNIPEDVIVEILSRVPLRSLPRLTCVSKQWGSLISTITATKTRSPVVLLVSESKADSFSPHSIDQDQEDPLESVHLPWEKKETLGYPFRILGSCNGFLLMSMGEDLFLWNPLTRFFKKVLAYFRLSDANYGVCSGLTYDSTCNEYKAVLRLAHMTPDYGGEFVAVGCFRRKSWTIVDVPYRVPSMSSGPIVDGKLHWFASKENSGNRFLSPHQIIYFNAHMDKFDEVPMPEPRGEDGDIICALGVLDGCLCMSRFVHPGNSESYVEVLIMKEYGVKTSWTILFTSSNSFTLHVYDTLVPLGYTKNGEVLTMVSQENNSNWQISAFNLSDNTHRRILVLNPHPYEVCVSAHEESLFTPTDYHWEEEELKREATYMESGRDWSRIMKKNKYGGWKSRYIESNLLAEPNSN